MVRLVAVVILHDSRSTNVLAHIRQALLIMGLFALDKHSNSIPSKLGEIVRPRLCFRDY